MAFFVVMFGVMKGTTILSRKIEQKGILTLLIIFTVTLLSLGLSVLFIGKDYRVFLLVGCGLLASIITGLGHGLKERKSDNS